MPTLINPESLGAPSGYANGLLADAGGKLLFISGQIAWNEKQRIVSDDFVEQFDRALANVLAVVDAAQRPRSTARAAPNPATSRPIRATPTSSTPAATTVRSSPASTGEPAS